MAALVESEDDLALRTITECREETRGIQGDSAQLGGEFVVDTEGIVRLAYRSHDPVHRLTVEQLLTVLDQLTTGR